jgi:hypothetical protein
LSSTEPRSIRSRERKGLLWSNRARAQAGGKGMPTTEKATATVEPSGLKEGLRRLWRGELPLWEAFWLYFVAGGFFASLLGLLLAGATVCHGICQGWTNWRCRCRAALRPFFFSSTGPLSSVCRDRCLAQCVIASCDRHPCKGLHIFFPQRHAASNWQHVLLCRLSRVRDLSHGAPWRAVRSAAGAGR